MAAAVPALETKIAYLQGLCGRGDEAIETHFAWIFLVGERAWKLRKPVARDSMDYRSLEARRRHSVAEVRLNRRLAPDVYLDAAPLTCDDLGMLAIDGRGDIVDWLVVMRRLDRRRMLDEQLQQESFRTAALAHVAQLLADFYRVATPAIDSGAAFVARIGRQVDANHTVLATSGLQHVAGLRDALHRYIARHDALLGERATSGCVVEAHGDLRPEHVFLGTPPAVIDCLEFDRDLRILDRAEELSFLELECVRLGHADAGRHIARQTLDLLGDAAPAHLRAFYRSHRAATRAKLYAWRATEPDGGTPEAWLERAAGYVNGALADARLGLA